MEQLLCIMKSVRNISDQLWVEECNLARKLPIQDLCYLMKTACPHQNHGRRLKGHGISVTRDLTGAAAGNEGDFVMIMGMEEFCRIAGATLNLCVRNTGCFWSISQCWNYHYYHPFVLYYMKGKGQQKLSAFCMKAVKDCPIIVFIEEASRYNHRKEGCFVENKFILAHDSVCCPDAIVKGDHYRFSVLTERIIRLEYDLEGRFEDRPSQTVLFRNFPAPAFSVCDTGARLEIDSKFFHLTYHYGKESKFTENSLTIDVKNNFTNYGGLWRFGTTVYGEPPRHHNLYGTVRTLDRANGAVALEYGLMDTSGHSFFDDSHTALLQPDGTFASRRSGTVDVYFVCCQHDYTQTLRDFFQLTGKPPMLPRYSLGNWWSRYHAYTTGEYLDLMDRFSAADVPFSMAVLDMDWHITDVDPKYGRGWTGYTWNRELIPDPPALMRQLHDKGLHTMLNLHPADGVQPFEDAYLPMASAIGADVLLEEPILFDISDPSFVNAYFKYLIHPLEDEGVDHWWIDWQQGRKCAVPDLDPLWLLNHYHYLDNCSQQRRGLILSRYAGLGSHRYPAGFSGDTVASWESLDFQAYFNLTAANVGFVFWSHDIGGFTGGIRDSELFIRWVQLGVFSPFLRLHATNNPFASKEIWRFLPSAQPVIAHWLRMRHRLIPYLYTEHWRQHTELIPVIRPSYYEYPQEPRAYSCKNQFFFGSSLLVCPITTPVDSATGLARVKAWIPEGVWTDLLTGRTYNGPRVVVLNRSVEQYPVLARGGSIIPLAVWPERCNSTENPQELEILVFPGAPGRYTMYEDDGIHEDRVFLTNFIYDPVEGVFSIIPSGDAQVIPQKRKYRVTFRGFTNFTPWGEGLESTLHDPDTNSVTAVFSAVDATKPLKINIGSATQEKGEWVMDELFRILNLAKISNNQKRAIYNCIQKAPSVSHALQELQADQTDWRIMEVLTELLLR